MEKRNFKLQSMTGFGRGFAKKEDVSCICEIRSVNLKGLDIKFRLPKELLSSESLYHKKTKCVLSRGRIEIFITINRKQAISQKITFNHKAASELTEDLLLFAKKQKGLDAQIKVGDLFKLSELFTTEETNDFDDAIKNISLEAQGLALIDLLKSRETEGRGMDLYLIKSLKACQDLMNKLKKEASQAPKKHYDSLLNRLSSLAAEHGFDKARLAQEAAFLADKSDVNEEIGRLHAHFNHFYDLCSIKSSGRKLDFLCQEMFREANTIGSKSSSFSESHLVVDLKSEIERLREQVQNIE